MDGGYLENMLKQDYGSARVNMAELARLAARDDELIRTYYYDCMPYQSDPPTLAEQERFDAKRRFIDAISYLPRFQVRLGKLQLRGTTADGAPILVQKRVDIMLCVDMALLALKKRIDRVVLLTGDGDAIPAVEAVKPEGVVVTLFHGPLGGHSQPSRELLRTADERIEIDAATIDAIRRS